MKEVRVVFQIDDEADEATFLVNLKLVYMGGDEHSDAAVEYVLEHTTGVDGIA